MTRYRAGYDLDYGRRAFDNRMGRLDVGSRGYDRGYLRTFGGGEYRRPWVGGYHEGYQGGSEGIAMNTAPSGRAYVHGEGTPWRAGYDRDYRSGPRYGGYGRGNPSIDRGDQGYMGGGGEYDPRYVRGARGGYDRGYHGYDREYREDLERNRPRYSPVGGMNPAMGGSAAMDRGRGRGYDGGWFNRWSRWF
ncbi:MAG TPA: hypothetical protein VHG28_24120 [Longimicrobiaceae bacterium]|nr:hypothetical protein [Longimicrobiaceae bacterium]